MQDKFTKLTLFGILICLIFIAFKTTKNIHIPPNPTPNLSVNADEFIQISDRIIGIKDKGSHTGYEQLLIFEYDQNTKSFHLNGTLNYTEYKDHPEKYGIPVKTN